MSDDMGPVGIIAVAVVLTQLMILVSTLVMGADDPPSTELRICGGTLPATSLLSDHDAACYDYTVSSVDTQGADLLNSNDDDTYRHVYYRGGDPSCVFTARLHHSPDHDQRFLTEVSGGRDCNASTPNGQCAYISSGYSVFAVTGQSCSQAGVPLCTGPFCI